MAAASAVVSDIIFLARQVVNGAAGRFPSIMYNPRKHMKIKNADDVETRYYLRFTTVDRTGVLAKISGILGKHKVSIASVFQHVKDNELLRRSKGVPIIVVTHLAREGDVQESIKKINRLSVILASTVMIRIEG